jgi:DNA-binding transcriptional MerR regulator
MGEFNLKAVLRQTGLTPETLRAWERRYGAVRPARTESGRRIYSTAEVHRLGLLSTLVRRGFRIGDIARLSDLELTRRIDESREPVGEQMSSQMSSTTSSRGISDVLHALESFNLIELREKMAQVRYRISPREFALELVPAIMYRVGTLIDETRFSIAEEHALSNLVQTELRSIYNSLEPIDGQHKPVRKMVFATREGDYHEVGLMLAAILCRSHGMQCQYLGANYPADSLSRAVKALRPFAVILALSYLPTEEERIAPRDYVLALDEQLPGATELWMGGTAVSHVKRPRSKRQTYIFESLHDLEKKLEAFL